MPGEFEIQLTVPSRYMCVDNSDDCRIQAGMVLDETGDYQCPTGDLAYYQSVFVWPGGQSDVPSCSLSFSTWPQVVKLPVKGVSDMLVDGDQVRSVQFSVSVSLQTTVQFSSVVTTRKVNLRTRNRLNCRQFVPFCKHCSSIYLLLKNNKTQLNVIKSVWVFLNSNNGPIGNWY